MIRAFSLAFALCFLMAQSGFAQDLNAAEAAALIEQLKGAQNGTVPPSPGQGQLQQGQGKGSAGKGQEEAEYTEPPRPIDPATGKPMTNKALRDLKTKEFEKKVAARVKDPFMLPNHLFTKIKKKMGDVPGEGFVDDSIEPQRRWGLQSYRLLGVIWGVKEPKAMIADKEQTVHMFKLKDRIGNNEGVITGIEEGGIIVNEKGFETKLKMK